jgi:hypothetical protein
MSTSRTRLPDWARHALKLMAVVVFPTPPFWLVTAIIRAPGLALAEDSGSSDTYFPVLE